MVSGLKAETTGNVHPGSRFKNSSSGSVLPGTLPKPLGVYGPLSAHLRSLWKVTRPPEVCRNRGNRCKVGISWPLILQGKCILRASSQSKGRSLSVSHLSIRLGHWHLAQCLAQNWCSINICQMNEWCPLVFPRSIWANIVQEGEVMVLVTVVYTWPRPRLAKDHPAFPRALGISVKKMNLKPTCALWTSQVKTGSYLQRQKLHEALQDGVHKNSTFYSSSFWNHTHVHSLQKSEHLILKWMIKVQVFGPPPLPLPTFILF